MAKLIVEKYVDGQFEKKIKIPMFVLHMALKILPDAALRKLKEKGIDLPAFNAASNTGQPCQAVVEIHEKRKNKIVIISLYHEMR